MSYTGAISDTTTGLSYMNARYYNPATGSFTSQDTYYGNAYLPKTQHLYSYTGGNPVNYIDPTGHGWFSNAWNSFTNWCSNAWNTTVDTVTSWFTPSDNSIESADESNTKSYNQINIPDPKYYYNFGFMDGISGDLNIFNNFDSNPDAKNKTYTIDATANATISSGFGYDKDYSNRGFIFSEYYMINYGNGGFSISLTDAYISSDGSYDELTYELSASVKSGLKFGKYEATGTVQGNTVSGTYSQDNFNIGTTLAFSYAYAHVNSFKELIDKLKNNIGNEPTPVPQLKITK